MQDTVQPRQYLVRHIGHVCGKEGGAARKGQDALLYELNATNALAHGITESPDMPW